MPHIDAAHLTALAQTGRLPKAAETQLGEFAIQAREHSYSPYSRFRVGAALLTASGEVFLGCNVENASYGGTICAERTAVCKAVASVPPSLRLRRSCTWMWADSEGHRKFVAIAVVTDKDVVCSPCGMCRQFMVEFGTHILVHQFSADLSVLAVQTLDELLPSSFGPSDLDK